MIWWKVNFNASFNCGLTILTFRITCSSFLITSIVINLCRYKRIWWNGSLIQGVNARALECWLSIFWWQSFRVHMTRYLTHIEARQNSLSLSYQLVALIVEHPFKGAITWHIKWLQNMACMRGQKKENNAIIPSHSQRSTETWDLWQSNIRSTFSLSRPGMNLMKCFIKYCLKTAWLDHPVSLTVPSAPGDFPLRSAGFIRFPGNTKNRGIAIPLALIHPRMVTV